MASGRTRLRIATLSLSLAAVLLLSSVPSRDIAAQGNPAVVGQWSFLPDLPFYSIHAHVLPTGRVLLWAGDPQNSGTAGTEVITWDPATGTTSPGPAASYSLFCAGHVFLRDGRLFVADGHIHILVGLPNATTFDPFNNLWTDVPVMSGGRWYPTATVLGNGDVLVVSGQVDTTQGENTLPSVYQVQSGTWRDLTSAAMFLDLYPKMHLAPDGRVFNSAPSLTSRALSTSGTGAWSVVANHAVPVYRDYGASVAYGPGRILVAGGSDPPTSTAEVIDLNQPNPAWRQVSSMAFARRQFNSAVLPDGRILVAGGTSGPGFNDALSPVLAAEMWDPATEAWTRMASAVIPRLYHSSLVLLPDGRLLTTGGNGTTQAEVYEPPYLFAGARPTVSSAPASVGHGQSFVVNTPDAASIAQVTLLSLASVTHTVDMNQRFNRLSFSQTAGALSIVAPPANLAPPGPYMLFILNGAGVPSVARIVRVEAPGAGTVPALSSLSPGSAAMGGPSFTLTANGSNFAQGSVVRWNGAARPTTFVSASRLTATISAGNLAVAGDASITVANPGGAVSNALAFGVDAFTVSPTTAEPGDTVTATWSGIPAPSATNRIALYVPGAPDNLTS